jgi:SAM-dependent methyltransferase
MTALAQIDKKMFEYINHLHFEGIDPMDLTWEEYSQRPPSPWKFPLELESWYKIIFYDNRDIINNKKVLDIGCEYGTKIPWFAKLQPSELICIDPNTSYFNIANYVSGLIGRTTTTKTLCVNSRAEDFACNADTIFLISVNHYVDDQFEIYKNLNCTHLVIDTWTDKDISLSHINNFLEKTYIIESKAYLRENRVLMRYKKIE